MLSILFLLIPILPSSYTRPQGVNNHCTTTGKSPKVGTKCVFPFRYKGQTYDECALGEVTSSLEDNDRWCSTKVHPNGTHVRGQGEWGLCSPGCFAPKVIPETERSCPGIDTCETKDSCPYIQIKYEEVLEATPDKKSELVKFLKSIVCNKKRKAFCCPMSGPPRLTTFAVDTTIQFRYARTSLHLEAVNPSSAPQQFPLSVTLPETAFIINMSLIYDGVEHVARVEEKELAQFLFQRAIDNGETAAQVKKSERDSQKVSVDVNIEPRETVSMVVTYEELLDRKLGRYKYSVSPGKVVDNYTVNIHIEESLPIKHLRSFDTSENKVTIEDDIFGGKFTVDPQVQLGDVELLGEKTALITYNPSRIEQERLGRDGGQINVEYDVKRNNEDNIVQVLDGYFVHFFAPELDPLPKHIIFVLDTSGSMEGIKMDQLKNAMVNSILEELTVRDYISILSFNDDVRIWGSGSQKVGDVRDDASRFILQLEAVGGTNINQALITAVNVAHTLKQREENVTPIIFFLTDGEATVGETRRETILENVKNRNHLGAQCNPLGEVDVPIFSLAFGADVDFTFLKDISLDNFAFAKKIYEGTDAAIQLEGFYQTIAKPLLKNVKFEYVGDIWEKNSLSQSGSIPTVFKGGENIAVGKLSPEHKTSDSENQIIIGGEGANGRNKYNHSVGFTDITNISSSSDINFVERLWAFKTIKLLLTAEPDDPRKEATNLSLKYNFVTDLTSLIVTKPGEEQAEVKPVPIKETGPFRPTITSHKELESDGFGLIDVRPPITATANLEPNFNYDDYGDNDYDIEGGAGVSEDIFGYVDDDYTIRRKSTTTTPSRTTTTTTPTPSSCNIAIFTKSYNRGDHQTFTEDQENLGSWDNKVVSLKVNGECCWRVFTQVNYGGNSMDFCERAYNTATDLGILFKDASSLRIESLKYIL